MPWTVKTGKTATTKVDNWKNNNNNKSGHFPSFPHAVFCSVTENKTKFKYKQCKVQRLLYIIIIEEQPMKRR